MGGNVPRISRYLRVFASVVAPLADRDCGPDHNVDSALSAPLFAHGNLKNWFAQCALGDGGKMVYYGMYLYMVKW